MPSFRYVAATSQKKTVLRGISRYHQSPYAIVPQSSRIGGKSIAKAIFTASLMRWQAKRRGFITTGIEIVKRETPLGLYKGLGAVLTGIIPKMAIRFTSFEAYKKFLANKNTGVVSSQATFVG